MQQNEDRCVSVPTRAPLDPAQVGATPLSPAYVWQALTTQAKGGGAELGLTRPATPKIFAPKSS